MSRIRKATVALPREAVRVSRIRRDPPPKPDRTVLRERQEQEARIVALGVLLFALAIAVLVVAISDYTNGDADVRQVHIRI